MDPISILGLSLAGVAIGEAILVKIYTVVKRRFGSPQPDFVSLPVSDTT